MSRIAGSGSRFLVGGRNCSADGSFSWSWIRARHVKVSSLEAGMGRLVSTHLEIELFRAREREQDVREHVDAWRSYRRWRYCDPLSVL